MFLSFGLPKRDDRAQGEFLLDISIDDVGDADGVGLGQRLAAARPHSRRRQTRRRLAGRYRPE